MNPQRGSWLTRSGLHCLLDVAELQLWNARTRTCRQKCTLTAECSLLLSLQRCNCVCFGSLHQTMLQESCQRTRDVARDHVPCEPASGATGLSCPVACYCETTLLRRQGRSGSWVTRRWRGFFVHRDGDRRQAPSLLSPYILETESFLCQNSPFEALRLSSLPCISCKSAQLGVARESL